MSRLFVRLKHSFAAKDDADSDGGTKWGRSGESADRRRPIIRATVCGGLPTRRYDGKQWAQSMRVS